MDNIFATVLITPNPGKMERVSPQHRTRLQPVLGKTIILNANYIQVKELLITVAKQVEELQETVLQYQLFEEVGREGEDLKEDRKVVVQINCE